MRIEKQRTPFVELNQDRGYIELKGRSIPNDAEAFYAQILDWLDQYCSNPSTTTKVVMNLEYFNISSSKRILFLLYKLNELVDNGHDVSIEWHYKENDDDMFEVGQDYAFMVKVPFNFVSYTLEESLAIAV